MRKGEANCHIRQEDRETAYSNLNSAVPARLSRIPVGMVTSLVNVDVDECQITSSHVIGNLMRLLRDALLCHT